MKGNDWLVSLFVAFVLGLTVVAFAVQRLAGG